MPRYKRYGIKLIRLLCKPELAEEIEGNLMEFDHILSNSEKRFIAFKFWYEVLLYLRLATLKQPKLIHTMTFNFNPKIAFRNLSRHRSNTLISLFGFVLGILSVTYLYFFIENEIHHDQFHSGKNEIYRLLRRAAPDGDGYNVGVTSGPFAAALQNDYPDIIRSTMRVLPQEGLVAYKDKKIIEKKILFADPNFFNFFSYPLTFGDKNTVLSTANAIVISKEISQKYFGEDDPIGKILVIDNEYSFIVQGILGEAPNKSHLEFNMVANIQFFNSFDWFKEWWSNGLITYVNIADKASALRLGQMLPQFMEKYFGEDFKRNGGRMGLLLQPLTELYFSDDVRFDMVKKGDKTGVIILIIVAISILTIACFNYINLAIAQSHKRAKEVGIRKVLGVSRARLTFQFLGESFIVVVLSVAVALLLSELIRPRLNNYFGLDVVFNRHDPIVFFFIISLILGIIVTSGVYPAMLLSSFKSLAILKGSKVSIGKSIIIRKGLVILQFVISIFLIISTILISSQLDFLKNIGLGYDQRSVLVVDINNGEISKNLDSFKKHLLQQSEIEYVTSASGEPGGFHDGTVVKVDGIESMVKVRSVFGDPDYLDVFDIKVVDGRGFDTRYSTEETSAMMVNRKFISDLGLTPHEIIGRNVNITYWGIERKIIGVFENYHFATLKDNIEPLMIVMEPDDRRMFAIKIKGDFQQALSQIEMAWNEFSPNFPIDYKLQEDKLSSHYQEERKQAKVFTAFALVSILLACLGVYGLASHAAQQRQKELSIRKVLGASIANIIGLISKEFLILVAIASLVAIPLAIYFMNDWLSSFAYHIVLREHWGSFFIAGITTLIIAALTIAVKTYKSAVSNPAQTMRYE